MCLKLESCTRGSWVSVGNPTLDPHDRVTVVYSYSDVHVSGLDLRVRPFFLHSVSVRTSPRKEGRYRFQATYTPRPWPTLGGSINILQQSNADVQTQFVGQNQNYGLTASLAPRERFGMDPAYNCNSVIQNALICFNDRPPAG